MNSELKSAKHPPVPVPRIVGSHTTLEYWGRALLSSLGENPDREGLERTPARMAKALLELTEGYRTNIAELVGQGVFSAEGSGLVTIKDVEFHSLCEHHVLPFWGVASVAYYPSDKILGLSKVPRIIDSFAKRLQVQERLTKQVVEAIHEVIAPRAVACRIVGEHMCMRMRGVEKTKGATATEFILGGENLSAGEIDRLWSSLD